MNLRTIFCFLFLILVQEFDFVPVSVLAIPTPEEKSVIGFNGAKESELSDQIPETGTGTGAAAETIDNGKADTRIIGGKDAKLGEFPWQLSLQVIRKPGGSPQHFCGATLISTTRVITASHCIVGAEIDKLVIVAGALNISKETEPTRQTVRAKSLVTHEDYAKDLYNDIAIIKLATPFNFTSYIKPLRLAPSEVDPVGKICVNTGWGIKKQSKSRFQYDSESRFEPNQISNQLPQDNSLSDILQKVNLTIWRQRDCQAAYSYSKSSDLIDPGMVCAGHNDEDLKGACFGDSGGPLVCYTGGNGPFLMGIVSFGDPKCGQKQYPTVYTRVNSYLGWIAANIN